jgi:DNA-binding NtrC family response regulator
MNNKQYLIGKSPKFQEVMRTVELVAALRVPIFISGETGTGKKRLAKEIHNKGKSRDFISVNCAALTHDISEAMLFGSKNNTDNKTSMETYDNFTGYIAQARSGTLFLEDISELSLATQAKLLNFLEYGEIQRVGDNTKRKYDVRIIASSSKDIKEEVDSGKFSADLFYRLNVVPIDLPSLRHREDDSVLLLDFFLRKLVKEQHQAAPDFTKAALNKIIQYDWPGNIRELSNFCERMFILFSGKTVDVTNLPSELRNHSRKTFVSSFVLPATGIKLDTLEVDLIKQALDSSSGNKSKAARLLGLTRDAFLYRLKKYSIDI